jgi:hypothetical protein
MTRFFFVISGLLIGERMFVVLPSGGNLEAPENGTGTEVKMKFATPPESAVPS